MITKQSQPNLLYIISDQHSASVLGCYGDPLVETPNLDRLAKSGVIFENAYCPSPICVPSRMSILSGKYPNDIEVWTNDHILDSAIPTFAHSMGAAGYYPILIGRMHSIGPDQLHGYAERLIGDHGSNYQFIISPPQGTSTDRGELNGTAGPDRISLKNSGPGQSGYQVHDEYVNAAAIDKINQIGIKRKTGESNDPFSLSVGFMLPHQPFVAREEDYALFRGRMMMPKHPDLELDHPYFRWWKKNCGIEKVTDEEIIRARTAYWALVTRMDRMIGEILESLEKNNLLDNTMIVYTSDHGEQVGERGLWWKQTFYNESSRVPIIVSWPGVIPEGQRCKRIVSSLDLTATIIDALDAPKLPTSRGRSLLPLITGEELDWDDIAFSEYCTYEGCIHRMIRYKEWKLNYYHGQEPQLFNLQDDPAELNDLALHPDYQEIRRELIGRVLKDWNPEEIKIKMEEKKKQIKLISNWVENTHPEEKYRWELKKSMNWLD